MSNKADVVAALQLARATALALPGDVIVPPPPPPPPPPVITTITRIPLTNAAKAVCFSGWLNFPNRYQRFENATIVSAQSPTVTVLTCNFTSGGSAVPFGAPLTLQLKFDGIVVDTRTVAANATSVTFAPDRTLVPEAWYMATVAGLDPTWMVLDFGVYVLKGAVAQPHSRMPVVIGSYSGVNHQQDHMWAWVPTVHQPRMVPYTRTSFPDIPTVPTRMDVVFSALVVPRDDDMYRPLITKEGIWTTTNKQNYFFSDFEQPVPILPMLDGPRGKGSVIAPSHLEIGNAAPNGSLRGNVYFLESWRAGKILPDGTVVTLFGYRHKDMASYWADPTSAELIGDWSSIPASRRGLSQPWGMVWDPRTLVIDETAAPIPTENNEKPHTLPPVLFVTDTYRNRVLKVTYSNIAHGIPPKVDEFITGLNQPWKIAAIPVAGGYELVLSDRKNNSIKFFDMDTGAFLRQWTVTQPEGLAFQDGWVHYTSVVTKSWRKRNVATGQDVLVSDVNTPGSGIGFRIDGNSRYMDLCLSDGTFGPRGMAGIQSWSNSGYGMPMLLDPTTGAQINYQTPPNGWTVVKGLNIESYWTHSYGAAAAIAHGRMVFGTAEEGLHVVSKALPTDFVVDHAKYNAGAQEYMNKGYVLIHGPAGYGYFGLALPWGESANMDYFLQVNGHVA